MSAPGSFPAGTLIPPRRRLTLAEKVVQSVVFALAAAAVLAVCWVLRFLVLPVVVGFLITYVMGPFVDRLENRGLSRSAAVSVCFSALVGMLAAVGMGLWPSIESWLQQAPEPGARSAFEVQLETRLDGWQAALSAKYKQVDWPAAFEHIRHFLQQQRKALVEGLPSMALNVLSHAGSIALALIIAFFVLLDGAAMKRGLMSYVPNRHFENALVMLHRVDRQVSSYLIGTALENLIVTALVAIPLWLVGMPNAFLFALLFGIANVIPFAGPFIGAAAGIFYSLLDPNSPSIGVLAAIYFVVHMIDAMVISPVVMGKSLNMHAMTIIVGISVGGTLGGILGMLVVIPMIAIAKAIASTIEQGLENASTD